MNSSYVKTCMTLIVLLLTVIAIKPIFMPNVAEAQGYFNDIQISSYDGQGFLLFDANSGRVFHYWTNGDAGRYWGRLVQPGKPLVK